MFERKNSASQANYQVMGKGKCKAKQNFVLRLETECPEKIIIKRELLVENSRGLNNELEVLKKFLYFTLKCQR